MIHDARGGVTHSMESGPSKVFVAGQMTDGCLQRLDGNADIPMVAGPARKALVAGCYAPSTPY